MRRYVDRRRRSGVRWPVELLRGSGWSEMFRRADRTADGHGERASSSTLGPGRLSRPPRRSHRNPAGPVEHRAGDDRRRARSAFLLILLSFNAISRDWVATPPDFSSACCATSFRPSGAEVGFPAETARDGAPPGAQPFDGAGVPDDGNPSVLCLSGAAWVHRISDRVPALKRRFGTRFVMTVTT